MPEVITSDCCRHGMEDGICRDCGKPAIGIPREGYTCFGCGAFMESETIKDCIYDCAVNSNKERQAQCNCCIDCQQDCGIESIIYAGGELPMPNNN